MKLYHGTNIDLLKNKGGCVIIDYGHLWFTLLLYIV